MRNLVIIWMDFAKSEETVAITAIFYEGGLKGGFDTRDARQIDVTSNLPFCAALKI